MGIAAMHYWIFLSYMVVDHIVNNKRYMPVLKNPVFITTTALTITNMVMDYLRRNQLTPFIDYDPPNHSWIYFTSEFLHYSTMTYLCAISLRLYLIRFKQPSDKMYSVRLISGFLSYFLGFTGLLMICIGLGTIWFIPNANRLLFTEPYHLSKVGVMLFGTVGFALPPSWMGWIFYPLRVYQRSSASHCRHVVKSLHAVMSSVVPGVRLYDPRIDDDDLDRIFIEIAEAMTVVYGNYPHHLPGVPHNDARFIAQLVGEGVRLMKYGAHSVTHPLDDTYIERVAAAFQLLPRPIAPVSPPLTALENRSDRNR